MLCRTEILGKMTLLLLTFSHVKCWDPDAGLIGGSLTKRPGVKVIASSNQNEADLVIDNKDETYWKSDGCLPMNYIYHEGENIFLHACEKGHCSASAGATHLSAATDGNFETDFYDKVADGKSEFHITLERDTIIRYITIKGEFQGIATLTVDHGNDHKTVTFLDNTDNYHKITFPLNNITASGVSITSDRSFSIGDIGALGALGCVDRLVVDLGKVETVSSIRVRAWPGEETYYSNLLTSLDMKTWHKVADIDPNFVHALTFKVDPPVQARYVAVEHDIHTRDWAKSFVWELDVFGSGGNFGGSTTGKPNPTSLHEMFGVNGVWGWGSKGPSKNLKPNEGAFLYNQIASNARNYHQMLWDVKQPGNKAGYENMTQGHGTDGESWLNWDTEYDLWVKANLSVDATIQFSADSFPPNVWKNPHKDAYQFGREFAAHFGPTKGNGLITAAEVGNEPWGYLHDFYATVLDGMANGLKDGDPGIKVLPAAFQAHNKNAENPPVANYIGTRVTESNAKHLDALNGHYYSFVTKPDGTRIMSYPEDPLSEFNGMKNLIRWRDVNVPNKAVWITEYGWDSAGAGETCTYSECVSEKAASVYGIRALLIMARLGIERAIWYYYANLDKTECDPAAAHEFCRSGLTGSKDVNFSKKKVFDIHKYFLDYVGDKHFLQVVKEDNDAYVYLLGDMKDGGTSYMGTHIVAWRPINADDNSTQSVSFDMKVQVKLSKYITPDGLIPSSHIASSGGQVTVSLKSEPVIVEVDPFPVQGGFSPVG